MLNVLWVIMVVAALVCGLLSGRMEAVSKASVSSAETAVSTAINLVGVMAFWIGAMLVLQRAGALNFLARLLRRPMQWLFPEVPPEHPAISMMIMNIASNMLGLANAATPFGLKAMLELDKLNREKGTATNAMALFLALNTSGLALLPTGIISLRSSLGSQAAGSIILTTFLATCASTAVAIAMALLLQRLPIFALAGAKRSAEPGPQSPGATAEEIDTSEAEALIASRPPWISGWKLALVGLAALLVLGSLILATIDMVAGTPTWMVGMKSFLGGTPTVGMGLAEGFRNAAAQWLLPLLIVFIALFAAGKRVKVYDGLVEGGKEGFNVALRIIPYLVVILVAVGMLRASGAIELMVEALNPITSLVGMPAETLPMALLRPLSGSGAYAVAAEIMKVNGPDSLIGTIVSTMQGSTETTFYVLALYFGVVGITRTRHTIVACLAADTTGALVSVWAVRLLLF